MKLHKLFFSIALLAAFIPLAAEADVRCGNGDDEDDCTTICGKVVCDGDPINTRRGSVSRVIDDLTVAGGFGSYPLRWSRRMGSRYQSGLVTPLGEGGSWRHSYFYDLFSFTHSNGTTSYTLNLPNGSEYVFKQDSSSTDPYMRTTAGSGLRLQQSPAGGTTFYFWQLDGGRVKFELLNVNSGQAYRATQVIDPYNQTTVLSYNTAGRLVTVAEPGGRTVQVAWDAVDWNNRPIISAVNGSDGQSVAYTYQTYISPGTAYLYTTLTRADYSDGSAATYSYQPSNKTGNAGRPLPWKFNDIRTSDSMPHIEYVFLQGSSLYGEISAEKSGQTGTTVYSYHMDSGVLTRGDGATKTFNFLADSQSRAWLIPSYTDYEGHTTSMTYDSRGFLATRTDPLGRITTWVREAYAGQPTKITNPAGRYVLYTYSSTTNPYWVTEYRDELNRLTKHTRDANNRVTRKDYPNLKYETWTYNSLGQVLSHRLETGGVEYFTYNASGQKLTHADPQNKTTSYTYDAMGRVATVTDPLNRAISYAYDQRANVTQVTFTGGSSVSHTYDAHGNRLTTSNELGKTWTTTYDEYRRKLTVTDPLNRVTQYSYGLTSGSGCGSCHTEADPTRITLPSGKAIAYTYDAENRKLTETVGFGTADAATTTYGYDAVGNLTSSTDPRGKTTTMTYDTLDRRISSTDPLGNQTQWTYDHVGSQLTEKRADNGVTTNVYDNMNRLTQSTDPKGQITKYEYDNRGNVSKLIDPRNNAYTFTYDLLDRKRKLIYPDTSYEEWTYNAVGRVATYRTRAGQIRTYSYDARHRETLADWNASTPDVSTTYDAAGRVLTMNSSVSALSYTYDDADQMLTETQQILSDGGPKTIAYTYDLDGNRATLGYPSGGTLSYSYTARNQVAAITADNPPPIVSYTYDAAGNRIGKNLENGTSTLYLHDDASRVLTVDHRAGGSSFAKYDYTYNSVSNRTSRTETAAGPAKNDLYGYDPVDQLTQVKYNFDSGSNTQERLVNYNHDAAGNRASVVDNGGTTSYTANNVNQYTAVGLSTPLHDTNGNLTSHEGSTFSYDAQNRLVAAVVSGVTAEFRYDVRNRCVRRSFSQQIAGQTSTTTTFYYFDGWNLVEEQDVNSTVLARYVHGATVDEILARITLAAAAYYHHDGLGSTAAVSSAAGAVLERYSYDAYGSVAFMDGNGTVVASSITGNRYLFTGREWLAAVGCYDYRNRVYSGQLGRFLQTDPLRLGGQDVNLYRYVGNSPQDFTDPLGLIKECAKLAIGRQSWIPKGDRQFVKKVKARAFGLVGMWTKRAGHNVLPTEMWFTLWRQDYDVITVWLMRCRDTCSPGWWTETLEETTAGTKKFLDVAFTTEGDDGEPPQA
jgi:RHS repeat-associated protein